MEKTQIRNVATQIMARMTDRNRITQLKKKKFYQPNLGMITLAETNKNGVISIVNQGQGSMDE